MVGSTTSAIITAILLTTELTWNFYSILPAIVTAITAFLLRKQICSESIYTLKLVRHGVNLAKYNDSSK